MAFSPPNSKHRALVTRAKKGKGKKALEEGCPQANIAEHLKAITWIQRLKRVFNIDIENRERGGGQVKVVSCIEDQEAIDKFLQHLALKELPPLSCVNGARGPPYRTALFQLEKPNPIGSPTACCGSEAGLRAPAACFFQENRRKTVRLRLSSRNEKAGLWRRQRN